MNDSSSAAARRVLAPAQLNALARELLFGTLRKGGHVTVDAVDIEEKAAEPRIGLSDHSPATPDNAAALGLTFHMEPTGTPSGTDKAPAAE